ncbi:MAG: hypothetical protein M0P47_09705 [Bacteroidales bacterium]|nr:hypothetical protein [Bacteroidales bacterium]
MNDFEKYIHDHREEFDTEEPPFDHFEKFESKLRRQQQAPINHGNRTVLLRVAALILILITVTVFAFDFGIRELRERLSTGNTASELPTDVQDAIQYYDNQVSVCMTKIEKLSDNSVEAKKLSNDALKEIEQLDVNTKEIKQVLGQNPNNERIKDALLQNQKMKANIMNDILNKLSKKEK